MQNRPCDVTPTGDQEKYSVALMNEQGKWFGFDVPLYLIYPATSDAPPALERVSINSFHSGRGFDRFIPNQYGYYDAFNGWSSTPGKFHPTMLQRWSKGLRNADENMPDANGVTWKTLVGSTKYLDVTFTASANYTAAQIILLIRKQVPAGTTGAPGTLTIELCPDSTGEPGTALATMTVTAANVTDVVSEYYVATLSVALTSGTTYHIKAYGGANDRDASSWGIGCDPSAAGLSSSTGAAASWSATTFSPYFRISDTDPARQYKPFLLDGALYLVTIYDDGVTSSELFLNGNRGRATGTQTSSTLQDTGYGAYTSALPTNRFVGSWIRIIKGTGRGQVRQITANDGDTYTVSPNWAVTPVTDSSEYIIYSCDWFIEIGTTGLSVVTGSPIVQNGIVYFPQGDTSTIRKMRIDYTTGSDHGFANEDASNSNKAYFLEASFDTVKNEPVTWRANESATSGSTPNASAVSVSRASTAPLGVPVSWSADMIFGNPILVGENTSLITSIHEHEAILYVFKEDGLYVVQNDHVARIRLGVETSPDIYNGRAVATAGDKNLYVAFREDVYIITGGGAYSTLLKNNMPANRVGEISSLLASEGWLFAAINGGTSNISSVMRFSLDTKSWSEQLRGYSAGKRIRNLQWQVCPETYPRLWVEVGGDMMFQEFPASGVRPYNDKTLKYQHEATITIPTIDLSTTDPKYFAVLSVTTQGLPQASDSESGHMLVVECQTDNDIGTDNWEHVDYIRNSPTSKVEMRKGSTRMLRVRLRLISSEATDPVIVEIVSLSLFTRRKLAHEWSMQFPVVGDDDEQNSVELLMWLRNVYQTAEPLTMFSRFTLFNNRRVTLADEPKYQLSELNEAENELEAQVWMKLVEVI